MGAADRDKVRRVLLCAGKVYYTLRDGRTAAERDGDIASCASSSCIRSREGTGCRARELSAQQESAGFRKNQEPRRWSFAEPRLRALLPDTILTYVGRDEAASPATGSAKQHVQEERELVTAALDLPAKKNPAVEKVVQPGTSPPRPIQRRCRGESDEGRIQQVEGRRRRNKSQLTPGQSRAAASPGCFGDDPPASARYHVRTSHVAGMANFPGSITIS